MSHKHEHSHNHIHSHSHAKISGNKLLITIILNVAITIAQIIGGIISGSMALLSDASHNFSDVLSLIISYVATKLSSKENSLNQTFGYKRAEIFAAFINAFTLVVIAIFILSQAIFHLFKPETITATIVIYLAALSILLNGASVLLIKKDAEDSINIKSAYLHLFTDMLTSIAVLVSGFVVKYYQLYWFDSVISILIAIYLIYHSWDIISTSLKIMMQFTPSNIDVNEIAKQINNIDEIKNIHHIHIWQLDENEIILDAHIDTQEDIHITEFEKLYSKIGGILQTFDIKHFTIQPEFSRCDNKNIIQE